MRKRKKLIRRNWSDVDWNQSTRAIAAKLGCSSSQVSHNRRKNAPETIFTERFPIQWDSIDWSLKNKEIAIITGKSISRVCLMRKRLNVGKKCRDCGGPIHTNFNYCGGCRSIRFQLIQKRSMDKYCLANRAKRNAQSEEWRKINPEKFRDAYMKSKQKSRNRSASNNYMTAIFAVQEFLQAVKNKQENDNENTK